MNNIQGLENTGGNVLDNHYYKFQDSNMVELTQDDYNLIITPKSTIKLRFPLGINGIISPIYNHTREDHFNFKNIIDIINDYYKGELSVEEKLLLNTQSGDEFQSYTHRHQLLDISNLCYFQGIENNNEVYLISLGS